MDVEIDETKLYVKEYRRGRLTAVEEWAVGGICRQTHECFVYAILVRNVAGLCANIEGNVAKEPISSQMGGQRTKVWKVWAIPTEQSIIQNTSKNALQLEFIRTLKIDAAG